MANQYTVRRIAQGHVEGIVHNMDISGTHLEGTVLCEGFHNIVGTPAKVFTKEEDFVRYRPNMTILAKINEYLA